MELKEAVEIASGLEELQQQVGLPMTKEDAVALMTLLDFARRAVKQLEMVYRGEGVQVKTDEIWQEARSAGLLD